MEEPTEEKVWYAPGEAADYLGVNLDRIGHLRRTGRLKGVEKDRFTMYHINDLKAVDTSDKRKKAAKAGEKRDEADEQGGCNTSVNLMLASLASGLHEAGLSASLVEVG